MEKHIKVWDGFIRGYHWLQLALIAALWFTAEQGMMAQHLLLAYLLLPLLLTRLLWGIVGSQTARFRHFVRSPRQGIAFLRSIRAGQAPHYLGHNPAGGLIVVALMTLVGVQLLTGLFANDTIFTEGPLAHWVSFETSDRLTGWHHLNFKLILALAAVHILAVLAHRLTGDNLLTAMFTGLKRSDRGNTLQMRSPWLAWGIFGVALAVVTYLWGWQALVMIWQG